MNRSQYIHSFDCPSFFSTSFVDVPLMFSVYCYFLRKRTMNRDQKARKYDPFLYIWRERGKPYTQSIIHIYG